MNFVQKASDAGLIQQFHGTNWTISLFSDDDFRLAALLSFWVVVFITVDEHDYVCILLNGT